MKTCMLFLLFVFLYWGNDIQGQTQEIVLKNYTPSPEAYSLMEYSEIPVSLYTGVPDISIPIYTIRVGNYSLPISLRYHASGIKVGQEASRIGLGWSIHAGGAISRSVRGWDDLKGYWTQTDTIPNEDSEYIWYSVYHDRKDYEPDIFHYNFDGFSGKFYANKGAGSSSIVPKFLLADPEGNLRIEYQGDEMDGSFVVVTPENVKYVFGIRETKESYGMVYGEAIDEHVGSYPGKASAFEPDHFDSETRTISSWLLTRIEYPTGDVITFEYDIYFDSYLSPINHSLKELRMISEDLFSNPGITWNEFRTMRPESTTSVSMELTDCEPVLRRIVWKDGSLDLVPSDDVRLDIRVPRGNTSAKRPKRLEKILLYAKNKSVPNLSYTFHHSYFEGRGSSGKVGDNTAKYLTHRLKLDSVSIQGTGETKQKYRMEYEMSDALPMKNSFCCDKWGYYNGYDSSKEVFPFVPFVARKDYYHYEREWRTENGKQYCYIYPIKSQVCIKEGEEHLAGPKDMRESNSLSRTWMLTGLVSPLEGRTEFQYEPNQVWSQYEYEWQVEDSAQVVTLVKDYNETEKTVSFDFPFDGYIDVVCTYDGKGEGYGYEVEKNTCLFELDMPSCHQYGLPEGLQNTGSKIHEQYTFTTRLKCLEKMKSATITARTAEWGRLTIQVKRYKARWVNREPFVGGVRVAEIKSPLSTRKFVYRDRERGLCSGLLHRNAEYSTTGILDVVSSIGTNNIVGCYQFIEYNSSAVRPLENPYNSYFMGYTEVSVTKEDKGKSICETSNFYNLAEPALVYWKDPSIPMPLNGKLSWQGVLADGKSLSAKSYKYDKRMIFRLKGLQVDENGHGYGYNVEGYHIPLLNCNESYYSHIPGKENSLSFNKYTTYEYNSSNFLVNKSTVTQTGHPKEEHTIRYSIDYPNYNDGIFQQNNLVTVPIEESFYTDGVLVKRLHHLHYKDSYIKPWKEYVHYNKEGYSFPPEFTGNVDQNLGVPELIYSSYSANGQAVSMQTRQGRSVVLIWGYQGQHIIAQIDGSSLEEVKSQGIVPDLIASREEPTEEDWRLLNQLRSRLPNAQVVTTRYEPLVGIVSQTDARGVTYRYTYDEFNRLCEVIETGEQEHVLRKTEYKYATEY